MWKCHLAKTNDDNVTDVDEIRVNAYTNLTVAVEATNLAVSLSDWYDEEITADSTVTIDDTVKVSCSFDNPEEVHPMPELVLKTISKEADSIEEIILSETATRGNGEITFSKNITKSDQDKRFVCESRQTLNDEEIFSSSVSSEPLLVVLPPTVMTQELPDSYIIDENEDDEDTIVIPIKFSSIPGPTDDDIVWKINEIDSNNGEDGNIPQYHKNDANETNPINSTLIMNPNASHLNYLTYPIENVGDDLYMTTIEISNITSNLTLVLIIANEHGDFQLTLPPILYYPKQEEIEILPVPPPNVKTGGISIGIIVGIIFILIILIVLIGAVGCYAQRRKPTNGDNIEGGKTRGKNKDARQYDLDNMPDDKLQTLEKKLHANSESQPMIHRSDSDETRKQKDEVDTFNGVINSETKVAKLETESKLKNENPDNPGIVINNVKTTKTTVMVTRTMKTTRTNNNNGDEEENVLFNEELLNVHTNRPNVYSGLQDLEPEVVLRNSSVFKDDGAEDENDTMIRTPDGTILRLSGPTNYPVLTPPPQNFTFERTPSRKTSQMHFMSPSEF